MFVKTINENIFYRLLIHTYQTIDLQLIMQGIKTLPEIYNTLISPKFFIHNLEKIQLADPKITPALNGMIKVEIEKKIRNSLLVSRGDFNTFFELQLPTILNLLYLRFSLQNYFNNINSILLEENISQWNGFQNIPFMGFVTLLTSVIQNKKSIGSLLHHQRLPLPIFFKIKDNKYAFEPSLCDLILGPNTCFLVFNIGSIQTRSSGKTQIITKMMNLTDKTRFTGLKDSFYLYTQPIFEPIEQKDNKPIFLMDFNGSLTKKNSTEIQTMIKKTSELSSLIFIHLKNDQFQKGALKQQQYSCLFVNDAKIIVFLRDSKFNSIKTLEMKDIKKYIPESINIIVIMIPNFKVLKDQNKQQMISFLFERLIELTSKSLLQLKPKLSLQTFNSQDQKKIQLFSNISDVIQPVKQKTFLKKTVIPFLVSSQIISNAKLSRNATKNEQAQKKFDDIISREQASQKEYRSSNFVLRTMDLISQKDIGKQLYTQLLNNEKNKIIDPIKIKRKTISTTDSQALDRIQQQINDYDLSLDDIVSQYVNSPCYQTQSSIGGKKAEIYYNKCYNDLSPINLIDGNTLQFGNNDLQDFLKTVKHDFKDIFVVSIFGGQSSGKSTLLNYLFRTNFETSSGRCTKGVNLSFCKIDDTLIVVLDTEGIMSSSARGQDFTRRIPTFVMMASDLIIVANRGQILDTFTKLMQKCLTYLKELDSSRPQTQKKILHKMMIALICLNTTDRKNEENQFTVVLGKLGKLKNERSLDYQDYISLTADDIFTLPNMYGSKTGISKYVRSINTFAEEYSNAVFGIRSYISRLIKDRGPKQNHSQQISTRNSLHDVYKNLKLQWDTLSQTPNLENFEQNYEAKKVIEIQSNFKKNQGQMTAIIKKNYDKVVIDKVKIESQAKFEQILNESERQTLKELKSKIRELSSSYFSQKSFEKIDKKFQILCFQQNVSKMEEYKKALKNFENESNFNKINSEKEKIKKQFNTDLSAGKNIDTGKLSLQFFEWATKNLPQKEYKKKEAFELMFKTAFNKILKEKSSSLKKIDIHHSLELNKKIGTPYKNLSKYLLTIRGEKKIFQISAKLTIQEKINSLDITIGEEIDNFVERVKISMNQLDIKEELDIHFKSLQLLPLIDQRIQIIDKAASRSYLDVTLYKQQFQQLLVSKLFILLQETFFNTITFQTKQYNTLQASQISNSTKDLKEYFQKEIRNINAGIQQVLQGDITEVYKAQLTVGKIKDIAKSYLNGEYQKLRNIYTPAKMMDIALKMTLSHQNRDYGNQKKSYYIQCYKFITNPAKFITEIFFNEPFARLKSYQFQQVIQKVISKIKNSINEKINSFSSISTYDALINKLKDYNMKSTKERIEKQKSYPPGQLSMQAVMILSKKLMVVNYQVREIMMGIKKQITDFSNKIYNDLKVKAVGCKSQCPTCGMKCVLQANHALDQHATLTGCHSLIAFAGCSYQINNQFATILCQSTSTKKRWKINSESYPSLYNMIQSTDYKWKSDFSKFDQPSNRKRLNQEQLLSIWAKIQQVMILTRFGSCKRSQETQLQKYKTITSNFVDIEDLSSYLKDY